MSLLYKPCFVVPSRFLAFLLSFLLLLLTSRGGATQNLTPQVTVHKKTVESLIQRQYGQLESFYQDLHKYPELSGQEVRTAKQVAEQLRLLGYEVLTGIGGHGLVGVLKNGQGPTTLIRADMDALPVPEATGLGYKSQNAGVMHACGHDFHLAALVGAAFVMAQTKNLWRGTLIFLAQPAEEIGMGARAMIKDGLLKKIPRPEQIIALHTSGKQKTGSIGLISGPAFANVDSVDVQFNGVGTHGSSPENGKDPFVQAAEFILKTQTILGREKPAQKPAVISVGAVHGGAKHNIIPEEVKLQLTVRSYEPELRKFILRRLRETAEGIAATAGAPKPVVTFSQGTDSTVNSPALGQRLKEIFIANFGKEVVLDVEPVMGGEDFGVFGSTFNVPSYMFWVGQRDEKKPTVSNHSPQFAPDFKATAPLAVAAFSLALLNLHSLEK